MSEPYDPRAVARVLAREWGLMGEERCELLGALLEAHAAGMAEAQSLPPPVVTAEEVKGLAEAHFDRIRNRVRKAADVESRPPWWGMEGRIPPVDYSYLPAPTDEASGAADQHCPGRGSGPSRRGNRGR